MPILDTAVIKKCSADVYWPKQIVADDKCATAPIRVPSLHSVGPLRHERLRHGDQSFAAHELPTLT